MATESRSLYDASMEVLMGFPWVENMRESFYLPPRTAQHTPIPRHLLSGGVGRWMRGDDRFRPGVWKHQGAGYDHLYAGENVCMTTDTSSGKSAVFIGHTLYLLDQYPDAKTIVFYPAKALQSDQLASWINAFEKAGYKKEDIGIINGDEKDEKKRLETVRRSKLILHTPDTAHSWLLANLKQPDVRGFLANTQFLVLDETHVYNEIFGSNAVHFFRRLQIAIDVIKRQESIRTKRPIVKPLQIFAASASLRNAKKFMKDLTGQDFVEIGQGYNGSAKHEQDVVHLAATRHEQLGVARSLIIKFLQAHDGAGPGTGICFIDSRQNVERLALEINARLGSNLVTSFVGNYSQETRDQILLELKSGDRTFVICTSVSELGVDYGDMAVGICVGVPDSPTSLQQRIGRVGRHQKGLSIVVADKDAFAEGKQRISLKERSSGNVADPVIYQDQPRVLAAHAICLQNEILQLGVPESFTPDARRYDLSPAFMDTLSKLRTGYPIMDDEMAARVKGRRNRHRPQTIFGLRDIEYGRSHRLIATMDDGKEVELGTTTHFYATYECYPGAVFHQNLKKFRVDEWSTGGKQTGGTPTIRMTQTHDSFQTYPIRQKWVNIPNHPKRLSAAPSIRFARGRIVEFPLTVMEETVGYYQYKASSEAQTSQSEPIYYYSKEDDGDAQEKRRRYRHFTSTTGVLFDFRGEIFTNEELLQLGRVIKDIYCEKFGISSRNVDFAASRIYQNTHYKPTEIPHSLVVYDRSMANLRLTGRLTSVIPEVIEAMKDDPMHFELRVKLATFYDNLTSSSTAVFEPPPTFYPSSDEVSTGPIFANTTVVWHQTASAVAGRNGRQGGAALSGEWVVIEGFKREGNEILYSVRPYNNSNQPRKSSRSDKLNVHLVNGRTLFLEPPGSN